MMGAYMECLIHVKKDDHLVFNVVKNYATPLTMKTLILLIFCFDALAISLQPKEKEDMILNALYYELYKRVEAIEKKMPKPAPKKSSINQGQRGKMIVQRLKAQARAKIAKSKGLDPEKFKSGKDIVKGQVDDNKKFIQHMNKIKKQMEELKKRSLTPAEWRAKYNEIYSKWQKEKEEYKKNIKLHQDNLIDIPIILPVSKKERKKEVKIEINKEHFIVDGAMSLPIRNQLARPTCSAFSAIRSLEIAMVQKGQIIDLSEQYFYWASKPKCQTRPCSTKGSWAGYGLLYSKEQQDLDIPDEKSCKYVNYSKDGNQTQIPLGDSCNKGVIKVKSFSYLKNLDQVVSKLMNNKPVMASIKLTPNFYKNNGLIIQSEASMGPAMDSHAAGHAVILVGLVKLPSALKEGKYCFLTANSWGVGWAQGGHSCISEKWLIENRNSNPFVVVNSIVSRD